MKADWRINAILKKHKIYLEMHLFSPETWDIVSVGWLQGLCCTHIPRLTAENDLASRLSKDDNGGQPPPFKLNNSRISSVALFHPLIPMPMKSNVSVAMLMP